MKSKYYHFSSIILLVFLFFSCSSDLDFDQVNDLKLEPAFVANVAYFDIPANKLIDDGGNHEADDARSFDVFKDKFFNDHLKKAELDFEIENTIDRAFVVNLFLLDANEKVLQTITFNVPAYRGAANVIKYPTEVFENERLELLKQTVKIGFKISISSGTPLNSQSLGSLKFRSGATAYLIIG
ncbi:hypothetical protein K6T82_06505 [Flavobacterium sp. 17A]|uniref:Uncharacterized protein n=1 Tax=Flavobacterium potami TaxID=2872310 RepID=A0A9X1H990_9FLAO|nr:hypothetical protein [Flavobacterium potami]MBZ4034408.1 hypothetical protein [Flavobacterium potami]